MRNVLAVRPVRPLRTGAMVSVPSRAAISVFDMNAFSRGSAGGGNAGFALSVYTTIAIRRSKGARPPRVEQSEQRLLFEHCVSRWAAVVGDAGPFELEVLETPLQHVGLASSAALQAATYAGLNWLAGTPLPETSLLELLYDSYKEVENDELVDGFTTGLSGFLNLYGGFVALDTDLRPLWHFALPAWKFAVAIPHGWGINTFGDAEDQLLMGDGKVLDERDREEKRRLIEGRLLPALQSQDLGDMGRAVREIQHLGNKRCQILRQGRRMDETLERLWASEIECVMLSSLGPAIVLLSASELAEFAPLFSELALDVAFSGELDNTGLAIRTLGDTDDVRLAEFRGRQSSPTPR